MKKVAVWLRDEEQDALVKYCEKEGRSMYAVLKEAVANVIGEESPITLKQDTRPSLPAPPSQTSPHLQRLEHRFANLEKQIDKITAYEQLWQEVSDLKANVGELNGLVSGLLLRLTKADELIDNKIKDVMVGVYEKIRREGRDQNGLI